MGGGTGKVSAEVCQRIRALRSGRCSGCFDELKSSPHRESFRGKVPPESIYSLQTTAVGRKPLPR